jgi:hypothetical protein
MPNLERKGYTPPIQPEHQSIASFTGRDILQTLATDSTLIKDGPKRQDILQGFNEALMQAVDKLPTKEQLLAYQRATSSPFGWLNTIDDAVYNGDFNFGRDVEAFFCKYCSFLLHDGSAANSYIRTLTA